jgi:hypothetical protein
MLKISNVVSYKLEDSDVYVLKEFENGSELLRMSNESTVVWNCKIPKSYDFIILKDLIYVTTKDSTKTLVVNKCNGGLCDPLMNTIVHVPVLFLDDSCIISFVSHLGTELYGLFDHDLNLISKLNPDSIKVSKVVSKDSFISFNKGVLSLNEFSDSSNIWSIDIVEIVRDILNEEEVKLRFLDVLILEKVLVISVFNTRSNNQYLFGLDKNTGKVNWHKKSIMNFGGVEKKLFGLERKGELKIFDIETGVLLRTKDLSKSFKEKSINCGRGLKIEGDNLLFKDEEQKKLGVIDLDRLDLKFVQVYPKDVDLSPNEYPQIIGERMVLHAPLSKELHFVGLEVYPA